MSHSIRNLDRRSSATATAMLALTATIAAAAGVQAADEPGPPAEPGQNASVPNPNSEPAKRALVGSWLETVVFPPEIGRPLLKSLGTFNADGTVVCSDQGAVSISPPSVFTSCHGAWTHLEDRTFAYSTLVLISDLSGNLFGYLKVSGTYTVSPSGDAYTGSSFAEIVDTDGVVLFSSPVTNAGQRITVHLP